MLDCDLGAWLLGGFAVLNLPGDSVLWICIWCSHFDRGCIARRNDLSALQPRTARRETDPLLLSGAFSSSTTKHVLAASRDVAICSRRYGVERDEAHRYPALTFTVTGFSRGRRLSYKTRALLEPTPRHNMVGKLGVVASCRTGRSFAATRVNVLP